MAFITHQHPIEDILNLGKDEKDALRNYLFSAILIKSGTFASSRIPFDAIMTDENGDVLSDDEGNVLYETTRATRS